MERFLLFDSAIYAPLLWIGFGLVGSVLPIALALGPARTVASAKVTLALASAMVVLGGHAFMYVFIVGGEAFPVELFPGKIVSSTFSDGAIASYSPSLPELLLGLGGYGVAGLLMVVGLWALPMLPGGFAEDAAAESEGKPVHPLPAQ